MYRVSINRSYIGRSLLFALLLLWPLLLTGRPAYMLDSGYYQNGGRAAVAFVEKKLHIAKPVPPAGVPAAAAGQAEDKVVARSIIYSVLAHLFSGPGQSMIYLAIFQALCLAFLINALFIAIAGPSLAAFATMTVVLVAGTGLAPIVNFMLPDVFAGVVLATLAILPFQWRKFSPALLFLVIVLASVSASMHASHPPMALGTALLATVVILALRARTARARSADIAVMWLPAVAGVGLTMLTGLIGFGEVSIAPKGFPLGLARALDNGPARWYLQDACGKHPHLYAMCEIYGTNPPDDVDKFLFKPGNVVNRATPEQLDRVRAEEKEILFRTTMRYPFHQAYIALRDVPRQIAAIRLTYLNFDGEIITTSAGKFLLKEPAQPEPPALIKLLSLVSQTIVLASVAVLAWRWRSLPFERRGVTLIVLAGLFANAAVCAIFSGVAARYQARLVWLLPFIAVAFVRRWGKAKASIRERKGA